MSNQCFFADPGALAVAREGDTLRLTGAEARHALVKRLEPDESIDVVDGQGRRAVCTVVDITADAVSLQVTGTAYEAAPDPSVTLVQALAKGDRSELAIEAATELGVDSVIPWQSDRSIVRWKADKATKGMRKWESVVFAATKQSRRSRVPEVIAPMDTDQLCAWMRKAGLVVVLHETAQGSLAHALKGRNPTTMQIVLVVGPEGGISEREINLFREQGAVTARLGRNVLRSSTAGPAALSLVMHELGRWDGQ